MSRAVPLLEVSGRFWRAVPVARVAAVLDPPAPDSAGRWHRPGQAALYCTREADWAAIALGRYSQADGVERVAVPLEIAAARVFDQRDPAACAALGVDPALGQGRWEAELAAGREPRSWAIADAARAAGADGLIDPSRGIVDGWHLTLFAWNAPGAPRVQVAGEPVPCDYASARARWPAPAGWALPERAPTR